MANGSNAKPMAPTCAESSEPHVGATPREEFLTGALLRSSPPGRLGGGGATATQPHSPATTTRPFPFLSPKPQTKRLNTPRRIPGHPETHPHSPDTTTGP